MTNKAKKSKMKTLKAVFMSCLMATVALTVGSCSSDDDDDEVEVYSYTLTLSYTDSSGNDLFSNGVSFSVDQMDYPTTAVQITSDKGLASVLVKITGGNDLVTASLSSYGLTSIELVGGNTTLQTVLSDFGYSFSAPSAGDTSYSFPISSFYGLLAAFGTTTSAHTFAITVTDADGNSVSNTLKVTISEDDYTMSIVYEGSDGTDYLTDGVSFYQTGDTYPTESIIVSASQGIAEIEVNITAGNTLAAQSLAYTGLESIKLVSAPETLSTYLQDLGYTFMAPAEGDEEYEFPISAFYGLLAALGATDDGSAHIFDVTVTDLAALSHTLTTSLEVTILSGSPISLTYTDDEGNDLFTTGVSYTTTGNDYPTSSITIDAAYGLATVQVDITGGNTTTQTVLSYVGLNSIELVNGSSTLATYLSDFGLSFTAPTAGATSYEFPIASFYTLLAAMGATDSAHVFAVTVTDQKGNTQSVTLNVTVTEGESTGDDDDDSTGGSSSDAISISYTGTDGTDYLTSGVSFSATYYNYPTTDFLISAPAGLSSVYVTITAGNTTFGTILSMAGMTSFELVGNTTLASMVAMMGATLTVPSAGDTSYTFPISTFYAMMASMGGATDEGSAHVFAITVTDADGNTASASLSVTVTE